MKGTRWGWVVGVAALVVGCGGGGKQANDGAVDTRDAPGDVAQERAEDQAGPDSPADAAAPDRPPEDASSPDGSDTRDGPNIPDASDASDAASDGAGDGPPPIAACQPGAAWFDLPYPVATAAYSRALDVLLLLPTTERTLRIVDPETCSDRAVELPRLGSWLSLDPSGRKVAVGHDGWMSIVDLGSMTVQATYPTNRPASELAFDSKGRVQLFTGGGGSFAPAAPIVAIDAASGSARVGTISSLDGDGHLRITPDGQSLYWLAGAGTTADTIQRVDVDTGALGTQRNGLHEFHVCHDVFPSDDSTRLYTACGDVLRVSSDKTQDLTYQATLEGVKLLAHLDSLAAKGVTVSVGATDPGLLSTPDISGFVRVHDTSTFKLVKTINLPTLADGTMTTAPVGRFVFIRSDGARYYALARRGGVTSARTMADGIARLDAADPGGDAGVPVIAVPPPPLSLEAGLPAPVAVARSAVALGFKVEDAAYSRALNRLVATSVMPTASVRLIDPDSGAAETIAMPANPSRVFLRSDGLAAAVVRTGGVTFLDLAARTVLREQEGAAAHVGFSMAPRVLIDDGATSLRRLDLTTGTLTSVFSSLSLLFAFGAVPDSPVFYTSESEGRLTRHDGTSVVSTDPYYDLGLLSKNDNVAPHCGGGTLAIADGAARAVLECGAVFGLSPTRGAADDLAYRGGLELTPAVVDVAYVPATHRFFVAPSLLVGGDSYFDIRDQVAIYDDQWLNFRALINVGAFPASTFQSETQRVFVGADPGRLYVLAKAIDFVTNGPAAIYAFDVSGL
jgi:hypothetical protein